MESRTAVTHVPDPAPPPTAAESGPPPSGKEVFEILAREHAGMLTAFLRSMVSRSEVVDDLFQETMLVAWRRLSEFDRSRPFGPWLRGIASRLMMQQWRKSSSDVMNCEAEVLEALDRRMGDFERTSGDTFRDRLARLGTCLERLPAPMREAVEMGYGRGMMLAAVAKALNATEEAVKKRVQRARQALADCLASAGGAA